MDENNLGRYELKSILGQGAMGIVYRAFDPEIRRNVAIKTIRLDLAESNFEEEELKERFFNEARSAGTMNHPNIVTVYDVGSRGNIAYIAMEYIEGSDLKEYMTAKGQLPFNEIFRIIYAVAQGLDYSGSKGIIHRDIKPANILLTSDGQIKITDFGIAKIPTSTVTQTGMLMGTPAYASPEQVMGKDLDMRSDLYSLGVIFYELVSGKRPFEGDPTTVIFQVVQATPPSPRLSFKDIPQGMREVIFKALNKNPAKRFQTGQELIEAIKDVEGLPNEMVDISKKARFSPLPKRKEKPVPPGHIRKILGNSATDEVNEVGVAPPGSYELTQKTLKDRPIRLMLLFALFIMSAAAYFYQDNLFGWYRNYFGYGTDKNNPQHINTTQIENNKANPVVPEPEIPDEDNKAVAPKSYPKLMIQSVPEGASVVINDQDDGLTTPVEYQISDATPEVFRVVLAKDCYQPFSLDVNKNQVPEEGIQAEMKPLVKEVNIVTEPDGAIIKVEGKEETLTAPTLLSIPCDKTLQITVSKEDHISQEHTINFPDVGEQLKISLTPIIYNGKLKVSTSYPVIIYKGKKKLGKISKVREFEFPPGKQTLTFKARKPVFADSKITFNIKQKKTSEVKLPRSGRISVSSIPGNARIWINGVDVDYAPLSDFRIAAGRYTLMYKWPDGKFYKERILVKSGRKHVFRAKKPQ